MKETMVMMRWSLVTLFMLGLALGGCSEPTEIVPVGPPGAEIVRVPPAEEEGPQALGEQISRPPTETSVKTAAEGAVSPPTPIGESKKTASGVSYETLKEGTGPEVKPGQTVTVQYTGTLEDGTVFDSSRGEGKSPFSFSLGAKQVIPGWEEGISGMKVGERRKLTIPPELGYGAQGSPPAIPPDATLHFDVEVIDAK